MDYGYRFTLTIKSTTAITEATATSVPTTAILTSAISATSATSETSTSVKTATLLIPTITASYATRTTAYSADGHHIPSALQHVIYFTVSIGLLPTYIFICNGS